MRLKKTLIRTMGWLICFLVLYAPAQAQWGSAVLEPVSAGPENDHLGQSSLALDDFGDLHLLFDRWAGGGDHDFYYTTKPYGGSWSAETPVGDHNAQLQNPYLAVDKTTGNAYAVYLQDGFLKLAREVGGVWSYYNLNTPYLEALFDPCVAVDGNGTAHVAFIIEHFGVFNIGYGYWDGPQSVNFHFQWLHETELGDYGSGASPDICVKSNGGVAISYRGGNYLSYRVDVVENFSLGDTTWVVWNISSPSFQCYSSSIKATADDCLHLAYSGNMGWGFPNHGFYTYKPDGALNWAPSVEVLGNFSGADPKLALVGNTTAHIVFQETSGNLYTGNILYSNNLSGNWSPQILITGEKYEPSLVMDPVGNGSLAFQEYAGSQNYDIYYYGCVDLGGTQPDIEINLIPENPPIIIPPAGGSFNYTIEVTNHTVLPVSFDVWTEVILPNGGVLPIFNLQDVTLNPGQTRSRAFSQVVPGRIPAGAYIYQGFCGTYPTVIVDADSFEITKLGEEICGGTDWICEELIETTLPQKSSLVSVYPNPFNAEAAILYEINDRSQVKLQIFDTLGRRTAALVDRMEEAGVHSVSWLAENQSAGVYFIQLTLNGVPSGVVKTALLK